MRAVVPSCDASGGIERDAIGRDCTVAAGAGGGSDGSGTPVRLQRSNVVVVARFGVETMYMFTDPGGIGDEVVIVCAGRMVK